MITSHICAWESPCLGCAHSQSQTILYHDVINLLVSVVGCMLSPLPRCLMYKCVCQHQIIVFSKLQ